jgi:hypothetical protein
MSVNGSRATLSPMDSARGRLLLWLPVVPHPERTRPLGPGRVRQSPEPSRRTPYVRAPRLLGVRAGAMKKLGTRHNLGQ